MLSPIKYHGGKGQLAKWLWAHSPPAHTAPGYTNTGYTHRIIPCAGGLGELLGCDAWPIDGIAEIVNDVNYHVSDFWSVLADTMYFARFKRIVDGIAFNESVFNHALEVLAEQRAMQWTIVDRAVAFYVVQRMGQQGRNGGSSFATPTSRLRRGMDESVSAWITSVNGLPEVHQRLLRVKLHCMDAIELIKMYDRIVGERAFYYIDPPYLDETRVGTGEYIAECDEHWHRRLLECLVDVKGKFMLSGYPSKLYKCFSYPLNWRTVTKTVTKSSSRQATKPQAVECIWMNY